MAITSYDWHAGPHWAYMSGTASANTDESEVLYCPTPMCTYSVLGSRAVAGNFTFTLQGSIDGESYTTIATCTGAAATSNYQHTVDKPMRYLKVLFTDVGSSSIKFRVLGIA
jgi:hypothetical protein